MYRPEFATSMDALDFHLLRSPGEPAALPGMDDMSYQQLDEGSSRVAAGLAAIGVGITDRVVFLGGPSPEYWEVLFACAKLGAVMVLVSEEVDGEDIDDVLEASAARVVFRSPQHKFYNVLGVAEILVSDAWEDWKSQCAPLMEYCFVGPDTSIVEYYEDSGGYLNGTVLTHQDWCIENMEGAKSR